jgi:hypothetical protein
MMMLKAYAMTDAGKKSGPESAGRGLPMLKVKTNRIGR